VELRAHGVGFRHELSRRAVESAVPAAVRMRCNARMLAVLLAEPDPDLTRLVHHAVAAGDEAAVIAHAPPRPAPRAGSGRTRRRLRCRSRRCGIAICSIPARRRRCGRNTPPP
jgi:hypothetical protein